MVRPSGDNATDGNAGFPSVSPEGSATARRANCGATVGAGLSIHTAAPAIAAEKIDADARAIHERRDDLAIPLDGVARCAGEESDRASSISDFASPMSRRR